MTVGYMLNRDNVKEVDRIFMHTFHIHPHTPTHTYRHTYIYIKEEHGGSRGDEMW